MSFWKSYFQFTRKERNGIILLVTIIVLIWVAYVGVDSFFKKDINDYLSFEQKVDDFYKSVDSANLVKQDTSITFFNKDTCFVDVNFPDFEHLLCIGLNEHLSKTWMNYIQKGGTFKQLDEVKKLWGMNDSIFNQILPYLKITAKENKYEKKTYSYEPPKNYKKTEKKIEMVELNTSDTSQLIALPGIGSSFASRIIKYRKRLGGFYNKEQLKEIYGLNQEIYDKISPYVYVDVFEIKKVNINTDDYSTLIQNPYFTKEAVKAILQYRKKSGKFMNANDLMIHQIVSEDEWTKLKWYVTF